MARYYDGDLLLKLKDESPHWHLDLYDLECYLEGVPTADVVEVRHGEWIKIDGNWKEQFTNRPLTIHQCSRCGMYYQNAPYRYCPNCGAKMDGKGDA